MSAILETDNSKLKAKIDLAEAAIKARLDELNGAAANDEKEELADATHGLTVLRSERHQKSA